MRIRLNPAVNPAVMLALLIISVPVTALANLTGTPTLSANTALSLDTGTISSSGGDILWNGSSMTQQSSATAYNIGNLGSAGFNMTQSILAVFSAPSLFTKSAIPASTLVVGDVFAVHTNGGNDAAVLVTATSGTSITLQFITYGVNSGPTITEVENNYGDVPAGFSNSGIAQGALFFVVGTGLATPGTVAVLQNAVGNTLPTTINGASIKVTVGSTTVTPALYYAQPTAVAGVLPSNTPLGAGTVTVTYNNQTSNSFNITVVASAFGFDTWNEAGTGLGVATTASGVLYTYSNSIPPGTTVVLWGSGLGADPKGTGGNTANGNRDTINVPVTSVAADSINSLTHIYVGGVDGGAPGYQGASGPGYPGVNQINFMIPANAPTGCNVSLVGTNSSGVPTNIITLPIGTGTCSDPTFGKSQRRPSVADPQRPDYRNHRPGGSCRDDDAIDQRRNSNLRGNRELRKQYWLRLRIFRRTGFRRRLHYQPERHCGQRQYRHFYRAGCGHNHSHQPVWHRGHPRRFLLGWRHHDFGYWLLFGTTDIRLYSHHGRNVYVQRHRRLGRGCLHRHGYFPQPGADVD